MKKTVTLVCLSALSLSLLGQGTLVAARTETTVAEPTSSFEVPQTEDTTSSTTVSEPVNTEEPTTSSSSESTSSESSSETTTSQETRSERTSEATEEPEAVESLRHVGGIIDTVVLPDGRLVFRVRLDSLVATYSSNIKYQIVHQKTGQVVDSGLLHFEHVDRSALKNFDFWGQSGKHNMISKEVGSYAFSKDPNGLYTFRVFGSANSDHKKTFGTVDIKKNLNMGSRPNTTAPFKRIGGVIETVSQPDGDLTYKISLDSLVKTYSSGIHYRIIRKGTGRVAHSGLLYFKDIDHSKLKDHTYVGQSGFNNVVSGTVYSYVFGKESHKNFIFELYGYGGAEYTNIFGIVNFSKDLSGEKPLPAGQKNVYRLHHPATKNYAYTTNFNEVSALEVKGWRYEGVAWKTETSKGQAVYRLYHPGRKYYFYTKNVNEYKTLAKQGWKQEGTAYRSYGSVPIYRLYHAGQKKHFYTRSTKERDTLVGRGWKAEGIAWYSQP